MLEIKTELGHDELAEIGTFFDTLDYASPYQHPLWPEELLPAQSKRFFLLRNEKILCFFASITESCLSNARFIKYATLARGPWCNNKQLLADMLVEIRTYYVQQKFASLYVQPDCDLQRAEWIYRTLRKKVPNLLPAPSSEFKATVLTALNRSEEDIYRSFTAHIRRQISKAIKLQIKIEITNNHSDYEKFKTIMRKMCEARHIFLYTESYLEKVYQFITMHSMGRFVAAYAGDGTMIGGLIIIKDGKKMHYLIAATDPDFKKLPQSHFTIFESIKFARQQGCAFFDFGSFKFNAAGDDQLFKVNNFKLEFGGKIHFHPRPFIMVTNLSSYRTGKMLMGLKAALGKIRGR